MPSIETVVGAVLDTHVWIWGAAGDIRATRLQSFRGKPVISAISLWEVAMLEAKGRLELKPGVETWLRANLAAPVAMEPLSIEISVASCRLEAFHGDPADRIIVATAQVLGLPLITADKEIIRWNSSAKAIPLLDCT